MGIVQILPRLFGCVVLNFWRLLSSSYSYAIGDGAKGHEEDLR